MFETIHTDVGSPRSTPRERTQEEESEMERLLDGYYEENHQKGDEDSFEEDFSDDASLVSSSGSDYEPLLGDRCPPQQALRRGDSCQPIHALGLNPYRRGGDLYHPCPEDESHAESSDEEEIWS
jgi:hypothetical protein